MTSLTHHANTVSYFTINQTFCSLLSIIMSKIVGHTICQPFYYVMRVLILWIKIPAKNAKRLAVNPG